LSWAVSGDGCGRGGDVAVGRDAEVDGGGPPGEEPVSLGEFRLCCCEADFQSFGFAGPAFAFGLGDAGGEAVADFLDPVPLGGVDPQEGAPDAAVLVNAARPVCPAAVAEGEPAALEVAEELLPFLVARGPVFLAGPQRPAAGDERPVDGFPGIGGLGISI
jgi:hypothetical protein